MNAVEMRGVTAGYGGAAAIRDLDLDVETGEIVALLGANGAGKSTTIRTICGLVSTRAGSVHLLGSDVTTATARARARLGLATVPDDRGIFTQLTVAENLRLGRGGGESRVPLQTWFPDLVPLVGRRAGLLSGGEQTLLALARALAGRPRVLVVDELTTGLAAGLAGAAFSVLRRAAVEWGVGVLVAEQSVNLALSVADRAYVLRRGQVAVEGRPRDLERQPGVLEATYLGEMS